MWSASAVTVRVPWWAALGAGPAWAAPKLSKQAQRYIKAERSDAAPVCRLGTMCVTI
jgi:hypothetical protein